MNVDLHSITVRELVAGYSDDGEGGVSGYSDRLDIRPPYQREFVYKDKQRDAVIDTIIRDFPLNVMYWAVRGDGKYEIIDGQQRTISVAQYVEGDFSFNGMYFYNLQDSERDKILDYPLMVYLCSGTDKERLDWFETINIAGEKLTKQELRNAVYAGPWLSDAKRHFSRNGCPAYQIAHRYLQGSAIRQDYLETAIRWISGDRIEDYMGRHQIEANAGVLWNYFQSVIYWVGETFSEYRKEMKGVEWGGLYASFKNASLDPHKLEAEVSRLMLDDDVTKKAGIYPYVLTCKKRHLNIRAFTEATRRGVYERQGGTCRVCGEHFVLSQMEADHITPWTEGGKTIADNCQMLCRDCNRRKSSK